jgi:hypothetical protein
MLKTLSLSMMQKILSWRHTGFNVHSQVRAETKRKTERVGKYMIRPLLSLKRLFFDETEGKVMAERPPPPQSVQQELLMAAEEMGKYF